MALTKLTITTINNNKSNCSIIVINNNSSNNNNPIKIGWFVIFLKLILF